MGQDDSTGRPKPPGQNAARARPESGRRRLPGRAGQRHPPLSPDPITSRKQHHRRGFWCPGAESNHRHEDFQSTALPLSYPGRVAVSVPPQGWAASRRAVRCCPEGSGGFPVVFASRPPCPPAASRAFRSVQPEAPTGYPGSENGTQCAPLSLPTPPSGRRHRITPERLDRKPPRITATGKMCKRLRGTAHLLKISTERGSKQVEFVRMFALCQIGPGRRSLDEAPLQQRGMDGRK